MCFSSCGAGSGVLTNFFVNERVSCANENRESFPGSFAKASGDTAQLDSKLNVGEEYSEEPGVNAAGVGGSGRLRYDGEASAARLAAIEE
jgi:hypothetical protein